MDISLSFNITIKGLSDAPALFIASYAMPALIDPSPITAITLRFVPFNILPTAMPKPAEIEVDEWPAPNGSNSDSARLVKPDNPPFCRKLVMRSRRPVKILCG